MPEPFVWATYVAYAALALALLMAVVRMVRGPSLPDRIVALDMISYLAIGFIALTTLVSGQSVFLDVALALALIAFLAVVAFARYVEQTYVAPEARNEVGR
jgi:multicomponent Na+:H+ antiporter subunit F